MLSSSNKLSLPVKSGLGQNAALSHKGLLANSNPNSARNYTEKS